MKTSQLPDLNHLASFNLEVRKAALLEFIGRPDFAHEPGDKGQVNLHIHSFYSFNAEDWSPTRIAWESRKCGLHAAGIIDFDVLDGLEEFIWAGDQLGLRTSVGLETRSFLAEMQDHEIDSPGEPGVSYIAGAGFTRRPKGGTSAEAFLLNLFERSKKRNLGLIERINARLPEIAINYTTDVLPLTPSGNATERHIVKAYIAKSAKNLNPPVRSLFWSELLEKQASEISGLLSNPTAMEDLVRSKLAKRGGLGYVQPSMDTFPETGEVFSWIRACGAIPMESWLDGTSSGENDPNKLLELSRSKGACALNIIPDRNWNIDDEKKRRIKVENLRAIIQAADAMGMPIHIGTEMNKAGQLFYDDLTGPVLKEFREVILRGAHIIIGHNILSRFAGVSFVGEKTDGQHPGGLSETNKSFCRVGQLPPPNNIQREELFSKGKTGAFDLIMDSALKGRWMI